jgi:HAE1 family hydrophobic/amphiphilic exporter-1
MAVLARDFPPALVSDIPFDTTKFVEQSIHEVYKTLYEAAILVLIVILVFLQDWRAMLVPATTVPVTIIGAFAAMAALGFTINFSTLFAIVLAIGIVVDDAIVVVAQPQYREGMPGAQPRARHGSFQHKISASRRVDVGVLLSASRRPDWAHVAQSAVTRGDRRSAINASPLPQSAVAAPAVPLTAQHFYRASTGLCAAEHGTRGSPAWSRGADSAVALALIAASPMVFARAERFLPTRIRAT